MPNERTSAERLADAALGAAASASVGSTIGASGDAKYSTKLEALILGDYSCVYLLPSDLTLSVSEINTAKNLASAIPVQKDWVAVAEISLEKGKYQFSLVHASTREISKDEFIFSGEALWKPTLKFRCPADERSNGL